MKVKVFIVEDMAISRMALENSLKANNYEVVGSTAKAEIAYEQLQNIKTDILLLDINLAGEKDGLWLANEVRRTLYLPIIYLTAYGDEKTLKKVETTNPNGYLMKPYNTPTLLTTINIALKNFYGANENIRELPKPISPPDYIYIKDGTSLKKVILDDIYYIKSDGNYLHVISSNKVFLIRNKLNEFCNLLPSDMFIQVHRRFVINKQHIDSINKNEVLVKNQTISISDSFKKNITSLSTA